MRTISPSIENRLAEHQRGMPVWIRAPKSGHEYYSGLSHAKLYELARRGVIRSFSLRDPGSSADLSKHGLPTLVGVIDLVRSGGRIVDFKLVGKTPAPEMVGRGDERSAMGLARSQDSPRFRGAGPTLAT